jgi:hypothetical protein
MIENAASHGRRKSNPSTNLDRLSGLQEVDAARVYRQ